MASIAKVTIDRARATQSLRMANGLVSQWLSGASSEVAFAWQAVSSIGMDHRRSFTNGDNVQLASYETDLFDPANPRYVTMKAMCGLLFDSLRLRLKRTRDCGWYSRVSDDYRWPAPGARVGPRLSKRSLRLRSSVSRHHQ